MARGQPGPKGGTKNATDKDYKDFIVNYISCGECLNTVEENTHIPINTLRAWRDKVINEDGKYHDKYRDYIENIRKEKEKADEEERQRHIKEDAKLRQELQTGYLQLQLMKMKQLMDDPEMLVTVPFTQMSTSYGTMVDKSRLISGDSTSKEEQHITIDLPQEVSDLFG